MSNETAVTDRGWSAAASYLTVSEFVQLIASGRKTGELEVSNGHCSGTLRFRDGLIQDAICGSSGKRGIHGAVCLLCMKGASAQFRPIDVGRSPEGSLATMGVLLEAARRMDEGERPCAGGHGDAMIGDGNGNHPEGAPAAERRPERRPARCLMFEFEGRHRMEPLDRPVMRVGRDEECEIFVPALSVSRRHADVHLIGPMLILRDVGSRNGTFVNGSKIRQARVDRGDEIVFGEVQAFVVIEEEFEAYRHTEPVLRVAQTRPSQNVLSQTVQIAVPGRKVVGRQDSVGISGEGA